MFLFNLFMGLPSTLKALIGGVLITIIFLISFVVWLNIHDKKVIDANSRDAAIKAYKKRQEINNDIIGLPLSELCVRLDGTWNKEKNQCE